MADDSLATPINKLPSISTRDGTKSVGDVSYADILKQQEMERHQFDQAAEQPPLQIPPPQPQFQMPPEQGAPTQPQFQNFGDQFQNQFQFQNQSQYPTQFPNPIQNQQPMYPPLEPETRPEDPLPEPPKKWWNVWIFQNKIGWIVGLVIFIILTFIYPKVRGMARFEGIPLPYWATGGMSALGAGLVTAINISL